MPRPKTHGTRSRYAAGCRCDDCKDAESSYQTNRRQTRAGGAPVVSIGGASAGRGPVEAGVRAELEGLAQAEARPGLAQTVLALARLMDDPKARNQQPAAAAKLADLLNQLRKGADTRKSRLAGVRQMTGAKSATG